MENVETKTMSVGAVTTDTLDKNENVQEAATKWTSEKLEASELTPGDRTQLERLCHESFQHDLTVHEDAFVFVIRAPTACAAVDDTKASETVQARATTTMASTATETEPKSRGGDRDDDTSSNSSRSSSRSSSRTDNGGGAETRIVSMAVVRIEPKGSSFVRVVCTDRRFRRRGCTSRLLIEIVAFLSRSRTVTTTGVDADTGELWEMLTPDERGEPVTRLELQVRPEHLDAIRLYERHGFRLEKTETADDVPVPPLRLMTRKIEPT
jgi:ribosomal protein S18 acetylase RimI-like enzyme